MQITNTSHLPTEVVRAIVRWVAREMEVTVPLVKVTGCKAAYRGRCNRSRILARIGGPAHFPRPTAAYRKRAPAYSLVDPIEALVALMGHEFGHTREFMQRDKVRAEWVQRNNTRPLGAPPIPATRFRTSEVECERHAWRMLSAFRAIRETIVNPAMTRHAEAAIVSVERDAARRAAEPDREADLLRERIKAWRTKAKRAATYIKKYERKLARLTAQT